MKDASGVNATGHIRIVVCLSGQDARMTIDPNAIATYYCAINAIVNEPKRQVSGNTLLLRRLSAHHVSRGKPIVCAICCCCLIHCSGHGAIVRGAGPGIGVTTVGGAI